MKKHGVIQAVDRWRQTGLRMFSTLQVSGWQPRRWAARLVVLGCLLGVSGPAAADFPPVAWPDGSELVRARCLVCHGGELIVGQRLTAEQWAKEIKKMRGWGAVLSDDEATRLQEFLVKNYGPEVPAYQPVRAPYQVR